MWRATSRALPYFNGAMERRLGHLPDIPNGRGKQWRVGYKSLHLARRFPMRDWSEVAGAGLVAVIDHRQKPSRLQLCVSASLASM